ncbi:MAG TPA: thermonuclease family protein [Phycisphaerae bacterium]|nr:thermonuclease family protein [Phycisphaerae bacterium]
MNADQRHLITRIAVAVTLFAGSGGYLAWALMADRSPDRNGARPRNVEVKRAMNGHTVKFEPDGKLTYAGIRAPYEHELFYEEAKRRNDELVRGRELRLRFDGDPPARDDRIIAWAFIDDVLVNEQLVREGLAYVRLTPAQQRYGMRLLDAQAEARSELRGVWGSRPASDATTYPADPKYGNFHRPDCDEVAKIDATRRVDLESANEALKRGLAPCSRCQP